MVSKVWHISLSECFLHLESSKYIFPFECTFPGAEGLLSQDTGDPKGPQHGGAGGGCEEDVAVEVDAGGGGVGDEAVPLGVEGEEGLGAVLQGGDVEQLGVRSQVLAILAHTK